ncbi:ABC transporter permease [Pleomorphomonas diazotrophica]|uniref:ABC transporter permease n=1 Tax=Pleomorphomonas diazotrophica TaxID=1166257 RepID=A0A1I4S9W5_9HYPH|nr:FtsX-like permease family protein [Pleomorphomonas diazotrophica]PKR88794.1 ABC transporter permease [Pleomorphomonas diazotrophica]SFM61275.1 putative ABC transport system permease protein [Pleomorphomonas diazotrophica]
MIRFVFADLRRLWAASLVIVLLVALATALGVAVTLQERALRLGSARAADKFDLIIGAPGSETQLVLSSVFLQPAALPLMPGEVLTKLVADPRVAWAAPIGFGDNFKGYPIVGTTTALISGTTTGFIAGEMFAHEGEAVVGSGVDLPIGAEVNPMHGTAGEGGETHADSAYHVVGKLQPTGTAWDRAILVPIQAVWHVHGLGEEQHEGEEHEDEAGEDHHDHGHIDADAPLDERFDHDVPGLPAVLVKPKTIADAYALRQAYRTEDGTRAVFPAEVLTGLYATLGDARAVLMYIAYGAQALVAAALMLIVVIHIAQRRKQIGALRAFGAPRLAVFGIVWLELLLLVAVGVGAGFGLGYGAASVLAGLFTAQSGVRLSVEFTSADAMLAVAFLAIAALMAALPAALAYRQSPVEALRG